MCQNSACGDDKTDGAIPDGRQGKVCQWGALLDQFSRKSFSARERSCYGLSIRKTQHIFNCKLGQLKIQDDVNRYFQTLSTLFPAPFEGGSVFKNINYKIYIQRMKDLLYQRNYCSVKYFTQDSFESRLTNSSAYRFQGGYIKKSKVGQMENQRNQSTGQN